MLKPQILYVCCTGRSKLWMQRQQWIPDDTSRCKCGLLQDRRCCSCACTQTYRCVLHAFHMLVACKVLCGMLLRTTATQREVRTRVHWGKWTGGCTNTPGWFNGDYGANGGKGFTCAEYVTKDWCWPKSEAGRAYKLGAKHNYPERNCCACGKAASEISILCPHLS